MKIHPGGFAVQNLPFFYTDAYKKEKGYLKMSKKFMSALMAFAMILGCVACFSSCTQSEDSSFLIGGIGPLTGDYANYGTSVRNGAQIAIDELNEKNPNGLFGFTLAFQFEDSAADNVSAVNAYGRLIDNGMKVSLGATLSGETAAVVAAAKEDGLLVLTPSGSAVSAISGSENAFRVCFSDPAQGTAAADYIAQYEIAKKVAVFYGSDNDYCVGLYDTFRAQCENKGIEIVEVQSFTSASSTDFSAQITKIQASGAELVFLPIYAAEAATFLTQAKGKLDNMKFFGCDGLDGLLSKLDNVSTANGVMMLTPFNADSTKENVKNFVDRYKAKYNATPDQFAADGYDAVYTVVAAMEQAGITADNMEDMNARIVAAMTKIELDGVTGKTTWTADGEPSKTAIAMVYQDGKTVEYTK